MTSNGIVKLAVKLLEEKKAIDVALLDIRGITSIGDYFVVASGGSTTQVKALADELEDKLSRQGTEPKRVERSASWVLLDYNDVIVHIFNHEARDFYCLERLWGDAPRITADSLPE